jgi:hypothetical protein
MRFDHVGIPTTEKKPRTQFGAATRVWITDAHKHSFRIKAQQHGFTPRAAFRMQEVTLSDFARAEPALFVTGKRRFGKRVGSVVIEPAEAGENSPPASSLHRVRNAASGQSSGQSAESARVAIVFWAPELLRKTLQETVATCG